MIIEKNNQEIPEYLDADFFKNVLANHLKTNEFELESLDFSMGSSGGENYLSYIYRVRVTYRQGDSSAKDFTYIVKSIPLDGARAMFAELNIFTKEVEMYMNVVPPIEDALGGVKVQPKCYYTAEKPVATMVFEDMMQSNCNLADRCKGLDEEHAKIVLKKLAQYHAGSMLLLEKDALLTESKLLETGIFTSAMLSNEMMVTNFNMTMSILAKRASQWTGYEKMAKYLGDNEKRSKYLEKIEESIHLASDDIVVINHGDMWVNNFLFKYEDGSKSPTDVFLIDFQGSYRGSLGLDINYLMCSSIQVDLLPKMHELIETAYYPAFEEALEKGGYKHIPSLKDIFREVKKKAFFGFMTTMIVLPTISMNREDSAENSVEKFNDTEFAERMKEIACSSPRFLDSCKYFLKKYDEHGMLD